MSIWNRDFECLPREELEQIQLERLQSTLNRVYENVSFYRKMFDRMDLLPEDIRSLSDLAKFPFTTREDLRRAYPYEMFAVPLKEVVRLHETSGTTSDPIVVGYTANDLKTWTELTARVLTGGGMIRDDVVQIAFPYGLFTGGLGLHYGAERVGASVIPISSGDPLKQIRIMQNFRTTVLICTPSYALHLAEVIQDEVVPLSSLSLRLGLFGGETWSEEVRGEIERRLHIAARDNYWLTEIMGPGVSFECEHCHGLHINEDHFIPEIVNPETGEVLPYRERGELVFTTLTKEAFPLIRYRTGDISSLLPGEGGCGRTLVRMSRVSGRSDDMLLVGGVRFFPSQVEAILIKVGGVLPRYKIVLEKEGFLDRMELWVEVSETIFSDEMRRLKEMERRITEELKNALGLTVRVKLVEPRTLEGLEGKIKKVLDKRKI